MLECFSISVQKNLTCIVLLELMTSAEHICEITRLNFTKNRSLSSDIMRTTDIQLQQLFINLRQFINPLFLLLPFELFLRHFFEFYSILLPSFIFI